MGPQFESMHSGSYWPTKYQTKNNNFLSPRKLHPVLRAERAEKDRFATGQKNYFFGCLMNVILDVGK